MLDTRALSPEIKKLLEVVRNQAKEYILAFDILSKEIQAIEQEKRQIHDLAQSLSNKVESLVTNAEDAVAITLSKFHETTKDLPALHENMTKIVQLRDNLVNSSRDIDKQISELNRAILEFKGYSEREIASTIKELSSQINEEFEKEAQKIDARINIKVKQLEAKFPSYDARMVQMSDLLNKELRQFGKELDTVSKRNKDTTAFKEELMKEVFIQFQELEDTLAPKIENLELRIKDIGSKVNQGVSYSQVIAKKEDNSDLNNIANKLKSKKQDDLNSIAVDKIESDVIILNKKVQEFAEFKEDVNDSFENTERKGNIAIILSGISLLGIILLVIYLLTKK